MDLISEKLDTRSVLQDIVDRNPGIRYREILRMTGLVNGVLSYHLAALEKSDQIRAERGARSVRYYPPRVSDRESGVIKHVRHGPVRDIIMFVFENDDCTFNEIVSRTKKAPSTISSHLKRLKDDGIISVRYGEYQLYKIADKELVGEVMSKYRQGYVDRVVDDFAEAVEEL